MKPELLAPAGSIESFHAAVEAGADAVYLGLTDFNARLRAKNFTVKTLSYLVPYAHKRNVKLYVTLNTLIKQAELEPVIHTLYQLDQIGVDALIVTDAGLIDIARKHFPRLRLHASTQMTIHNSAGVKAAVQLGLKRVILSRELTIDEIRAIKKSTTMELEVFVHGALCYGISGLCLASSFLGGSSGNRGRCTQVCRRRFACTDNGGADGFFFSPGDLSAVAFLPMLAGLGISGLKIEGRMKSATYVYTVVSVYRKAIDNEISIEKASGMLRHDLAREKTTLFLDGLGQTGIIDAEAQTGVGEFIGTIMEAGGDTIIVDAARALVTGDRIRIQPESGFEGEAVDLRSVSYKDNRTCLMLKAAVGCRAGDTVFLISRKADDARFDRTGTAGAEHTAFESRCAFIRKILAKYCTDPRLPERRDVLWLKIDTIDWVGHLNNTPCQRLIFAGNRAEMVKLLNDKALLKTWKSRLLVGLPPFIPEHEINGWRSLVGECRMAGISRGVCSNIAHAVIFQKGYSLFADAPLGCLNRASQVALEDRGFSGFIHSYEDDYLNIKASSSQKGIVCLFSHVPLFVSRIPPAVRPGSEISDPHENRFFTAEAAGLFYLLSKEPCGITHHRRKLSEAGVHDFMLDLSFCRPDPAFLQTIIDCYKNNTRPPDTGLFNFKAGLK